MNRRIRLFFLCFGILFLFFWGGFRLFFWVDTLQEKKQVTRNSSIIRLTPEQLALLEEGDIILRRGYGFFSDIISQKLHDSLFDVTHSAILYRENNKWRVIHSLSSDVSPIDGMQSQSLHNFLRHSMPEKLLVVRPKKITPEQGKEIVSRAKYYLSLKIPFDHIGTIDEPSKLYCSELIYQILDHDLHLVSFPTEYKKRKEAFYTMRTLYDPQYFEIIINTYPK